MKASAVALLASLAVTAAPHPGGAQDSRQQPKRERPDPQDRASRGARSGGPVGVTIGDVPAGKTLTIVFRATVDAAPFPDGKDDISNQGTASGTNFTNVLTDDPALPGPADPTLTPLNAAPDFLLSKSDGGATVAPGGTVAYVLGYTNVGTQHASGVVLSDMVPANTVFNPGASTAGWACVPDNNAGSACTLPAGSLPVGAPGSATFAVTVVNPVPAGVTQISNAATIGDGGVNGADPTPGNNTASDTTPVDAAPDMAVTKSDGGASAVPGGTVSYTLSYSNVGNQGATGVVLTDTVPANTTFNPGASTAGWVCTPDNNAGSTCSLAVGSLAGGGANGSATFAVTLANPLPAGVNQIANTASVADDGSNGADPNAANNSGSDTTPITAAPDLSLTKSDGGATGVPAGTVAYALGYSNVGNQGATGLVLTETVPASTTFNAGASTAGWICTPNGSAGSSCTLSVGAVVAGGNGSATFAVTVANPVPAGLTQISNTASVADDGTNGPDPNLANNSATDTTPITAVPDMALTKSDGGASVPPGGTLAYTLSYSNLGNQGATGVALTETVPPNTVFNAGASTAGWLCTPDGNPGSTCTLTIAGSIAGGGGSGSALFGLTVDDPIPAGVTQISNTASVADDGTNGADPNGANNTGSDTTPIDAAPDLSLTKSDAGATVVPGGTVAYTLSYVNVGNRGSTGVVLTETVPASTTFDAGASTAGWVCTPDGNPGSTCTLAVGGLAGGGGSGSAVFAVTVANPVPAGLGQISNTATIADDGTNGVDPNPANNTGSDTTPVDAVPDLALTKDDGGISTLPSGTVPYTLSYANVGNQGATGVVLTETVPANTTFDAGASTAGWVCTPNGNAGSSCTLAIGGLVGGGGTGAAVFAVTVSSSLPAGVTQIANTAAVADDGANGPDPNPGDNTANDTTPVTAVPDLRITKDDGMTAVRPGQLVPYTLSYENVGQQGATGVVVSDTIPANTTFDAGGSTAGWVCTPDGNPGSVCTLAVGSLMAGSGVQAVTFALTIASPVPGGTVIANTATIDDDGSNGPDPNPGDNSSTDTDSVLNTKGDFNGDGTTDILLRNDTTGKIVAWLMSGVMRIGGGFTSPDSYGDTGWRVVGTSDFDDDGKTDILWRHAVNGGISAWLMDGLTRTAAVPASPSLLADTNWRIVASGDFGSDAQSDILWRHAVSGKNVVWYMNGVTRTAGVYTNPDVLPDTHWKIAGAGDFNAGTDAKPDILWQHRISGKIVMWLMDGITRTSGTFANPAGLVDTNWEIAGVGDFNLDSHSDLLWRHGLSGKFVVWYMDGITRTAGVYTIPDSVPGSPAPSGTLWKIVGPK